MVAGTGARRRHAVAPVAALVLLLALAGCGLVSGGGGRPAPRLHTSAAERASWPKAPPSATKARVERVVDGAR